MAADPPTSELIAISVNMSSGALEKLDDYRFEQRLTRPALIEALIVHLAEIEKAAPKVMAQVVRDAGRIQQDRTRGRKRT